MSVSENATERFGQASQEAKPAANADLNNEANSSIELEKAKSMADQQQVKESSKSPTATTEGAANGHTEVTALSVKSEKPEDKKGALQISPSGSIWNRPVAPAEMTVVESISAAGVRPIAASNLEVYGTILNNRPIMASNLRVLDNTILADHRPIFASDLVVRDDLSLPGGRPIVASDPALLEASLLPGGRPIASNDIDDPEAIMGFID